MQCRAVGVLLSFDAHAQRLLLLVLLSNVPDHPASTQGMAFLAKLLSLASLVSWFRLMPDSSCQTSAPPCPRAQLARRHDCTVPRCGAAPACP